MSSADGFRFTEGQAEELERAIAANVTGAVVDQADSEFMPGAEALKISHERASWTLEVVPMYGEFFICYSRSLALFSEEARFDRARRGLSDSAVDWVVETVERAFRFGVIVVRRPRGETDFFLGDEVGDIERALKSGAEVIRQFPGSSH